MTVSKKDAQVVLVKALTSLGWEHKGDTGREGEQWLFRKLKGDDKTKIVRVMVKPSVIEAKVLLLVQYLNLSLGAGNEQMGEIQMQVECGAGIEDALVIQQTEQATRRCLEICVDVIAGTGVASREAILGDSQGSDNEPGRAETEGW